MKSEVKNDFKNRHGDSNAFYLSISTYQSIIKDNRNNWFEGKSYSTGCKIKNNFIVDLVTEENKKKNVEKK